MPVRRPRPRSASSWTTRRRSRRSRPTSSSTIAPGGPTLEIIDGRLVELDLARAHRPSRPGRDPRPARRRRPRARRPLADVPCRDGRAGAAARRRRMGLARLDPGRGPAHTRRAHPGHDLGARPAPRRRAGRPGRYAARPVGGRVGPGAGDGRGGHPGGRLLRPGPALRFRTVSGRGRRATRGVEPPPRRGAADGRPARRGAPAPGPARHGDGARGDHAHVHRAAGDRWSTSSACRPATT